MTIWPLTARTLPAPKALPPEALTFVSTKARIDASSVALTAIDGGRDVLVPDERLGRRRGRR